VCLYLKKKKLFVVLKDTEYNEIIEKIRKIKDENEVAKKSLEDAFPKLKDERIRETLCFIVSNMPYMETELRASGLSKEQVLAWLENLPTDEEMLRTLHLEYEKGVADTIAKYKY